MLLALDFFNIASEGAAIGGDFKWESHQVEQLQI